MLTVPPKAGTLSAHIGLLAPGPWPASLFSCESGDVPALLELIIWLDRGWGKKADDAPVVENATEEKNLERESRQLGEQWVPRSCVRTESWDKNDLNKVQV